MEKEALLSFWSVAPTVIADLADAGDELHASSDSFPAATTTMIPAFVALSTASFMGT